MTASTFPSIDMLRPSRLSAVARLLFLEDRAGAEFGAVARATAVSFGVRAAAVNLVLTNTVAVVGSYGLPAWVEEVGGLPGKWGPCTDVVERGAAVLITDLAERYRATPNPIVEADGLRSYAGVPLFFAGEVVGAICVFDDRPGFLTEESLTVLACVAGHVARELFPGE